MTDVGQDIKKTIVKKAGVKNATKATVKSDETLLKDAKERIMSLQKKTKKVGKNSVKKSSKNGKRKIHKRGVVYLGHLPHGFYEEELRGFFTQFGKVARVKVSRSSKTGKSKGYAFVEFAYNDVAKIVAETMNNYLMFERLVKAQYIPPEKVHDKMFPARFITPESYPTLVRRNRIMANQEKPANEEKKKKHRSRIEFKITRAVNVLQDMGIDYLPQIYDPEADKYSTKKKDSEMDTDEVPELVAIPPATIDPPKKASKAAKKVGAIVESTASAEAPSQPEESTPSKKSPKPQKKAKKDNKRVLDSTVNGPETPNKKLKSKDIDVASPNADDAKKAKVAVKASSNSTKASPLPAKTAVASSPSPAKTSALPHSKKLAKTSKNPKSKQSKASATTSPKPSEKPDSKKAKPKTLVKEVALSPKKIVTRSAKGKKTV